MQFIETFLGFLIFAPLTAAFFGFIVWLVPAITFRDAVARLGLRPFAFFVTGYVFIGTMSVYLVVWHADHDPAPMLGTVASLGLVWGVRRWWRRRRASGGGSRTVARFSRAGGARGYPPLPPGSHGYGTGQPGTAWPPGYGQGHPPGAPPQAGPGGPVPNAGGWPVPGTPAPPRRVAGYPLASPPPARSPGGSGVPPTSRPSPTSPTSPTAADSGSDEVFDWTFHDWDPEIGPDGEDDRRDGDGDGDDGGGGSNPSGPSGPSGPRGSSKP